MSREKIIKRVRALLEKNKDNGATESEAMAALEKANQLMRDYYISELDVKDPYAIEKCILKEVPLIKSAYDLSIFYSDLAKLFDCEYFYNSRRIAFFGFEEDTELCAYFYNLITKTCLKEKDLYLKAPNGLNAKKYHHGRTLSAAFINGFLIKVSSKMYQMYRDKVSNLPPETGLMVIKKESKVKDQFQALNIKIKSVPEKELVFQEMGFRAGVEKGEEFHLTQGVKNHYEEKIIKIGN